MPSKKLKTNPADGLLSTGVSLIRGRVVAAKQPKTVTVLVERKKTHPFYKKSFMRRKKYLVHDELGVLEGDVVEIVKIKPISKNKHFGVVRVVGKDIEVMVSQHLKEEAAAEIAEVMSEEKESSVESLESSKEVSIEEKVLRVSKVRKEKV